MSAARSKDQCNGFCTFYWGQIMTADVNCPAHGLKATFGPAVTRRSNPRDDLSELEALKHDIARHGAICAEQATEIERLRAALERYGRHWNECPSVASISASCTCGYREFCPQCKAEHRSDETPRSPSSELASQVREKAQGTMDAPFWRYVADEIERLRAGLRAMADYRTLDGRRLDEGAGYEFAQYAAELRAGPAHENVQHRSAFFGDEP